MSIPEPSSGPASPSGPPPAAPREGGPWARAPLSARLALFVAVAVGLGALAWPRLSPAVVETTSPEDRAAVAAEERAMYDAMLRLSPAPLTAGPLVAGDLGPGDGERPDGRYVDYYRHEADSSAFSVVLTAEAFAPDLAVRLPDGRTVGASDLLRTDTRAEVPGLVGPGAFEVVVTSRAAGAAGAYELSVERPAAIDTMEVGGEPRADTLGAGPRRAGRFARAIGLRAEADVPVVVRVTSSAFAPRVRLVGPNGVVRGGATVEHLAPEDGVHAAVVRYLPGFDGGYRLEVSSEAAGARGPFTVEAGPLTTQDLQLGSGPVRATLGPESWLDADRYIDVYRVRLADPTAVRLEAASRAFPPAFRLSKVTGRDRERVADRPNPGGGGAVAFEGELAAGEYLLEVTSGDGDDGQPLGGEYVVQLEGDRADPAPAAGEAVPRRFETEVRAVGASGGDRFEVGVTYVALSYPNDERARVQLSVTVRSLTYTGNWAPWDSFARQAYVVDDAGRRYGVSVGESRSPSGGRAEPGTARRGTLVFYHPAPVGGQKQLVLVASVGEEEVTLRIPVE